MAKTKTRPKKSRRDKKSVLNSTASFSTNPLSAPPPEPEPEPETTTKALISQATNLLHTSSLPSEALVLLNLALQQSPTSLQALELQAEAYIDLGNESSARAAFEKAVELDPTGLHETAGGSGPEKFLWLAQLCETGGSSAVEWYSRGVEVLRMWISERDCGNGGGGSGGEIAEELAERGLEKKLCSALCGMAEIYMSDLCMEPDAEQRCEQYVTEALLADPSSAEALQTLASVRISQQREEDAIAALNRSFEAWKDLDPNSLEIPTYASRITLSKLMIETACYESAIQVLERLQLEDDQLPDLWYLGGWALFLLGERQRQEQGSDDISVDGGAGAGAGAAGWKELWEASREWLGNCLHLYKTLQWEDEGINEHANEVLEELNRVLPDCTTTNEDGGEVEEEEGDGEEEWEDDSDDSDEEMEG